LASPYFAVLRPFPSFPMCSPLARFCQTTGEVPGRGPRPAGLRRFALSQTLDRTSTNTATNAKHRGKNHRELFLAHLAH